MLKNMKKFDRLPGFGFFSNLFFFGQKEFCEFVWCHLDKKEKGQRHLGNRHLVKSHLADRAMAFKV